MTAWFLVLTLCIGDACRDVPAPGAPYYTREDCLLDGLRLAAGLMRGEDFERVEVSCVELPLERT